MLRIRRILRDYQEAGRLNIRFVGARHRREKRIRLRQLLGAPTSASIRGAATAANDYRDHGVWGLRSLGSGA